MGASCSSSERTRAKGGDGRPLHVLLPEELEIETPEHSSSGAPREPFVPDQHQPAQSVGGPSRAASFDWRTDDEAYAWLLLGGSVGALTRRSAFALPQPLSLRAWLLLCLFLLDSGQALALVLVVLIQHGIPAGVALLALLTSAQYLATWALARSSLEHTERSGPVRTLLRFGPAAIAWIDCLVAWAIVAALPAAFLRLLRWLRLRCGRGGGDEDGGPLLSDDALSALHDVGGAAPQQQQDEQQLLPAMVALRLSLHAMVQALPTAALLAYALLAPGAASAASFGLAGVPALQLRLLLLSSCGCVFVHLLLATAAARSAALPPWGYALRAALPGRDAGPPLHAIMLGLAREVTVRPPTPAEVASACGLVGAMGGPVLALKLSSAPAAADGEAARWQWQGQDLEGQQDDKDVGSAERPHRPLGRAAADLSLATQLLVPLGPSGRLRSLHLEGVQLGSRAARQLAAGLRAARALRELTLSRCALGDAGTTALAEGLAATASPLHAVRLCRDSITDYAAGALSSSLARLPLRELVLTANRIGEVGTAAILDSLASQRRLQILDLARNRLGPAGANVLAVRVWALPALQQLRLGDNKLTDPGGAALIEALSRCAVLGTLWLNANELGAKSAAALAGLVRASTELRGLFLHANALGTAPPAVLYGRAAEAAESPLRPAARRRGGGLFDDEGEATERGHAGSSLAAAIAASASLRLLSLAANALTDEAAGALSEAALSASVAELHLWGQGSLLSPAAREAIGAAWRAAPRAGRSVRRRAVLELPLARAEEDSVNEEAAAANEAGFAGRP